MTTDPGPGPGTVPGGRGKSPAHSDSEESSSESEQDSEEEEEEERFEPHPEVLYETLFDAKREPVGYRIWIFCKDLAGAMLSLMGSIDNSNKEPERKKKKKPAVKDKLKIYPAAAGMIIELFIPYAKEDNRKKCSEDLSTATTEGNLFGRFRAPDFELCPETFFGHTGTVRSTPEIVGNVQRSPNSYSSEGGGIKFPLPGEVYRIPMYMFNAETLSHLPMVHVVKGMASSIRAFEEGEDVEEEYGGESPSDDWYGLRERVRKAVYFMYEYRNNMTVGKVTKSFEQKFLGAPPDSSGEPDVNDRSEIGHRLRLENAREKAVIRRRCKNDPDRFEKEMKVFRENAAEEFWEVFCNSNDIPKSVVLGRDWFLSLDNRARHADRPRNHENLSTFGDMMATINRSVSKIFGVVSSNRLFFQMFVALLAGTRRYFDLNIQLMITGGAEAGKSFVAKLIETLSHPGGCMNLTNTTPKAFNTDNPPCGTMLLYEETPLHILGKGSNKKDLPGGDTDFKNRTTSGATGGLYFYTDLNTGRRKTGTHKAPCYNSGVMLTNEELTRENASPVTSRMIVLTKSRSEGTGELTTVLDAMMGLRFNESISERGLIESEERHDIQLYSFYQMVAENLIAAEVIPDVCMDLVLMMLPRVSEEMKRRYGFSTATRQTQNVLNVARTLTILYANHVVLFSELGEGMRKDENGKYKDFDVKRYVEKIPLYMSCSREVLIFGITLFMGMFTPVMMQQILSWSNRNGVWPPYRDEANTRFRKLVTPSPTACGYSVEPDNNYVTVASGMTEDDVAKDVVSYISDHFGEVASLGNVKHMLNHMKGATIRQKEALYKQGFKKKWDPAGPIKKFDILKEDADDDEDPIQVEEEEGGQKVEHRMRCPRQDKAVRQGGARMRRDRPVHPSGFHPGTTVSHGPDLQRRGRTGETGRTRRRVLLLLLLVVVLFFFLFRKKKKKVWRGRGVFCRKQKKKASRGRRTRKRIRRGNFLREIPPPPNGQLAPAHIRTRQPRLVRTAEQAQGRLREQLGLHEAGQVHLPAEQAGQALFVRLERHVGGHHDGGGRMHGDVRPAPEPEAHRDGDAFRRQEVGGASSGRSSRQGHGVEKQEGGNGRPHTLSGRPDRREQGSYQEDEGGRGNRRKPRKPRKRGRGIRIDADVRSRARRNVRQEEKEGQGKGKRLGRRVESDARRYVAVGTGILNIFF